MQISVTLNKRLYWQLQGTYIDEEEWIPWHSRCQPPYGINEVNHTLKSIKQYVPNIFLLTWTCLIKKRKKPTFCQEMNKLSAFQLSSLTEKNRLTILA